MNDKPADSRFPVLAAGDLENTAREQEAARVRASDLRQRRAEYRAEGRRYVREVLIWLLVFWAAVAWMLLH